MGNKIWGFILMTVVIIAAVWFVAKYKLPQGPDSNLAHSIACTRANGKWVAQYKECEGVSASTCGELKGKFEECASVCRHDNSAKLCVMSCVPVCSL